MISVFIFFALIICVNKNVNADGVVVDELLRNVIEQNMNTRQDLLDYYEDDIQVNDDQIIVNLKHTPEKYKLDSPIKVTWKDETAENRPDVIPVTLKSKSSNKVYATIELKKKIIGNIL